MANAGGRRLNAVIGISLRLLVGKWSICREPEPAEAPDRLFAVRAGLRRPRYTGRVAIIQQRPNRPRNAKRARVRLRLKLKAYRFSGFARLFLAKGQCHDPIVHKYRSRRNIFGGGIRPDRKHGFWKAAPVLRPPMCMSAPRFGCRQWRPAVCAALVIWSARRPWWI